MVTLHDVLASHATPIRPHLSLSNFHAINCNIAARPEKDKYIVVEKSSVRNTYKDFKPTSLRKLKLSTQTKLCVEYAVCTNNSPGNLLYSATTDANSPRA